MDFHQLPTPDNSIIGRNRPEPAPGEFSLARIAKVLLPRGAADKLVACVSRFACRLLDRQTGKAYSADELLTLPGTPVNGVKATGTLSLSDPAADGDTITVGGVVYTFTTSEPTEAYEVAAADDSSNDASAFATALRDGATEGLVGPGTPPHPTVTATSVGPDALLVARTAGSAGNAIATTEASGVASFGAATLTGGVDATPGAAGDMRVDATHLYVVASMSAGLPVWRKIDHSAL
jgi:hypothetical protein